MKKDDIQRVCVIGAGLMGYGIAVEYARFGYDVNIHNTKAESSRTAMRQAREALDLMAETALISTDQADAAFMKIHPFTDIEQAADGSDFVIESVLEIMDLKKEVFALLDRICPPPTILATNTSGFLVTDIAKAAVHPERVIATHYFQPPHFIPLVEVVPGEKTDPAVVDVTCSLLKGLRKKVALINVELPNFVGNRIQSMIGMEVQSLVDQGVCSPETIDDIISFGFGRRLAYTGFFKRLDLIGLDFIETFYKERGIEPWKPIADRVKNGDLGMKTGKGFYEWPGESAEALHRRLNTELIRLMKMDMEEGRI
jgi:3-hydroxybutyryl-CoA dehydrogenase